MSAFGLQSGLLSQNAGQSEVRGEARIGPPTTSGIRSGPQGEQVLGRDLQGVVDGVSQSIMAVASVLTAFIA